MPSRTPGGLSSRLTSIEKRLAMSEVRVVPPLRYDKRSNTLSWDGNDDFVALITGGGSGGMYDWQEKVPSTTPNIWVDGPRSGTASGLALNELNGNGGAPLVRVPAWRARDGRLYFSVQTC